MKRTLFISLVSFMIVSILGIVALQGYWIYSAWEDKEEEFSLELRTRDRERKLIKKIEKTINLIKEDDFGFCESCGIEIGIRRLEARPTADLCVDCKTLAEIKEKQSGRG